MSDETEQAPSNNNTYTQLLKAIATQRTPTVEPQPDTQQAPTTAGELAPDETGIIHDARTPVSTPVAWSEYAESESWPTSDSDDDDAAHSRRTVTIFAVCMAVVVLGCGCIIYLIVNRHSESNAPSSAHGVGPTSTTAPRSVPPPQAAAPSPEPTRPSVVIQDGWPVGWKNAAKAFEQVPPPEGTCYADDGAPFTWENFIGPAVNCTAPVGAQTGGFAPIPPRMRGILPNDPNVRRQFGDTDAPAAPPASTPVETVPPTADCTERSCPGGNF